MRLLLIAGAAAIALSGCTSTDLGKIDTAIQQNLPKACSALQTAHAAFVAVSASGTIKQSTVAKEAAAYQGVATICADTPSVTASNALVLVATAYAAVALAMKEAKDAN
jgi:hypothetical protein